MGRWNYTVFGGDPDMSIVICIEKEVGVLISDQPGKLEEARIKLDAGLGAKLMKLFRSKESCSMWGMQFMQEQEYTTLMLGAYMMHVGAKIPPDDREHLKACFDKFPGRNGYVFCLNDSAFRSAGKVQYGAALTHYVDGQPRSFLEPSCYNCGKISADLNGQQLKRCTRCAKYEKNSCYCSRECQKENWKEHKEICCPRTMGMTGGHLGFLAMTSVV